MLKTRKLRRARLSRRTSLPALQGERSVLVQIAILAFLFVMSVCVLTDLAFRPVAPPSRPAEAAIQLIPAAGRDAEADLALAMSIARETAGIAGVRAVSKSDAEKLLRPWLDPGLDPSTLPVPRLVVVTLDPGVRPDLAALARRLKERIPGAVLDGRGAELRRPVAGAAVDLGAVAGVSALALCAVVAGAGAAVASTVRSSAPRLQLLGLLGGEPGLIARRYARDLFASGSFASGLGAAAALGG